MRSKIVLIALLLLSISTSPTSYAQSYKKLWKLVEEAISGTEQMKRIATLYDLNNIQSNNITALTKLEELQSAYAPEYSAHSSSEKIIIKK